MNDDNCELWIVRCHSGEESKQSRGITWCQLLLTLQARALRSANLLAMQMAHARWCKEWNKSSWTDPAKARIIGWLVKAEMLRSSMRTVGVSWIAGRALPNQGSGVHRSCKKALGWRRQFLDSDGSCKSGNLQPDCFHCANTCAHELQHPQQRAKNNDGRKSLVGQLEKGAAETSGKQKRQEGVEAASQLKIGKSASQDERHCCHCQRQKESQTEM